MRIAVAGEWDGGGWLQPLADDGLPAGPPEPVPDLTAAIRDREKAHRPRWVWAATEQVYPALVEADVRVERCHDLALTEALLLAYAGRWGEPRSLGAAWARLRGLPVPEDHRPDSRHTQPALFEPDRSGLPPGTSPLEAVREVYRGQLRRIGEAEHAERLRLLVAAESAGALAAAEMGHDGLPWRADVHDALLTELLGPRPPAGALPARLGELAQRISAVFGQRVNPDSPAQVVRAFTAAGISVPSTRSHVLRRVDHPAVPLLLEYKELSRLYTAHGWAWLDTWVRDGRFRPEYVVGGVVSGRWASRGGAALQIPRALRRAVIADPGWVLVVADAGQLEPRVLAALSGDQGLAAAAGPGDLYAALAKDAFGGDRDRAKIALLAAMYGQTSGEAGELLGVLRRRFPAAVAYVEDAARAGEEGRIVRSRLGRTCPPPSAGWRAAAGEEGGAGRAARSRGRFTRNFVVQASAADWALVLLAALRRRLGALARPDPARAPHLVFFQHDEVLVHCPEPLAAEVVAAVVAAGDEARRLVFGDTPVRFPLDVAVVGCYADAK